MKKLLSILASVGLAASASTVVVACTSHTAKKADVDATAGTVTYKGVGINLDKDYLQRNLKAGDSIAEGYSVFDNKGNLVTDRITIGSITITKSSDRDLKKGSEVKADIVLGITDKTKFESNKKYTFKLGQPKSSDATKIDMTDAKLTFKTPKDGFTGNYNGGGDHPVNPGTKEPTISNASIDSSYKVITLTGTNLPTTVDKSKLSVTNGRTALEYDATSTDTTVTITLNTAISQTDANQTISISYQPEGMKTAWSGTVTVPAATETAVSINDAAVTKDSSDTDYSVFDIAVTIPEHAAIKSGDDVTNDLKINGVDGASIKSAIVAESSIKVTLNSGIQTYDNQTISFTAKDKDTKLSGTTGSLDIPAKANDQKISIDKAVVSKDAKDTDYSVFDIAVALPDHSVIADGGDVKDDLTVNGVKDASVKSAIVSKDKITVTLNSGIEQTYDKQTISFSATPNSLDLVGTTNCFDIKAKDNDVATSIANAAVTKDKDDTDNSVFDIAITIPEHAIIKAGDDVSSDLSVKGIDGASIKTAAVQSGSIKVTLNKGITPTYSDQTISFSSNDGDKKITGTTDEYTIKAKADDQKISIDQAAVSKDDNDKNYSVFDIAITIPDHSIIKDGNDVSSDLSVKGIDGASIKTAKVAGNKIVVTLNSPVKLTYSDQTISFSALPNDLNLEGSTKSLTIPAKANDVVASIDGKTVTTSDNKTFKIAFSIPDHAVVKAGDDVAKDLTLKGAKGTIATAVVANDSITVTLDKAIDPTYDNAQKISFAAVDGDTKLSGTTGTCEIPAKANDQKISIDKANVTIDTSKKDYSVFDIAITLPDHSIMGVGKDIKDDLTVTGVDNASIKSAIVAKDKIVVTLNAGITQTYDKQTISFAAKTSDVNVTGTTGTCEIPAKANDQKISIDNAKVTVDSSKADYSVFDIAITLPDHSIMGVGKDIKDDLTVTGVDNASIKSAIVAKDKIVVTLNAGITQTYDKQTISFAAKASDVNVTGTTGTCEIPAKANDQKISIDKANVTIDTSKKDYSVFDIAITLPDHSIMGVGKDIKDDLTVTGVDNASIKSAIVAKDKIVVTLNAGITQTYDKQTISFAAKASDVNVTGTTGTCEIPAKANDKVTPIDGSELKQDDSVTDYSVIDISVSIVPHAILTDGEDVSSELEIVGAPEGITIASAVFSGSTIKVTLSGSPQGDTEGSISFKAKDGSKILSGTTGSLTIPAKAPATPETPSDNTNPEKTQD